MIQVWLVDIKSMLVSIFFCCVELIHTLTLLLIIVLLLNNFIGNFLAFVVSFLSTKYEVISLLLYQCCDVINYYSCFWRPCRQKREEEIGDPAVEVAEVKRNRVTKTTTSVLSLDSLPQPPSFAVSSVTVSFVLSG